MQRRPSGVFSPEQTSGQVVNIQLTSLWQLLDTDQSKSLDDDAIELADRLCACRLRQQSSKEESNLASSLRSTSQDGKTHLYEFSKNFQDGQNAELSAHLLDEADGIAQTWFTDNKWPRIRVTYTRLFLPFVHVTCAVALGIEHLFGKLSARGLMATARGALEALWGPLLQSRAASEMLGLLTHGLSMLDLPFEVMAVLYYGLILAVIFGLMGTLYVWSTSAEPEAADLPGLLAGVRRGATADALHFFNTLQTGHVADSRKPTLMSHFIRPMSRLQKPWQFALLGATFWLPVLLSGVDPVTRLMAAGGRVPWEGRDSLEEICEVVEHMNSLTLLQYFAFCGVFLLASVSEACELAAPFRHSWEMDKAVLHRYKFDTGCPEVPAVSAREVYHWLLHADVPLDFELSTILWDAVKRYLFIPCCIAYAALPVAVAAWSTRGCTTAATMQQALVAATLAVPNLATAFVFQSYMMSIAATVRRKLHAVRGLKHMLSPLGALVVGLPAVQLQYPRSYLAWFRLRQFVISSFEFHAMVRVEIGFTATLALIVVLQVLLLGAVTAQYWHHALLLLYFYFICVVYGFGTLVVAINTSQEIAAHCEEVEALRIGYLSAVHLGWDTHKHGSREDRVVARDVALSVHETVVWMQSHKIQQRAGIQLSRTSLTMLRAFMVALAGLTLSRIPPVMSFWAVISASPAFSRVKELHALLGPLARVLGIM